MSKKNPYLTDEERELFRRHAAITKSIKQDKILIKPQKSSLPRPQNDQEEIQLRIHDSSSALLEKLLPDDWLTAEDYIHFARTGIPYRTLNKLKRGLFPIQVRIDLHRMTGEEVLERMNLFLQRYHKDQRCILIIHGKGGIEPNKRPILKNLLNLWLRQQPEVLAFHTAKPRDGGSGALYVLLKQRT